MSRIVVSLGGNALGKNPEEQKQLLKTVSKSIIALIKEGHEVVIAHGNGPQVGMINLAFLESTSTPNMPFPECGAMSQGYIGFHLQNALGNELSRLNIEKTVASVVTQVIVDQNDPAFQHPTKPIGNFYSKEEAFQLEKENGWKMVEDAGRGYRRVVPSPMPIDVKEKAVIQSLLKDGHIVITVGGGGIPVIQENNILTGVPAVIDKDNASAKLAELINADILVILTAVDNVYVNFGKPEAKSLEAIKIDELEAYIKEDQFAKGSMLPKVQACINFAQTGKTAVISSLQNAEHAFKLKSGTIITK